MYYLNRLYMIYYKWFRVLEVYPISIINCRCIFCKLKHVWLERYAYKRDFAVIRKILHYIKVIIYQFSCSPSKCGNSFQYRWMLKNLMTLNLGTELVLPSPRTHTLAMISSPKSFTLQIQVTLFFQLVLKFHFKNCWRTHHPCNHNWNHLKH